MGRNAGGPHDFSYALGARLRNHQTTRADAMDWRRGALELPRVSVEFKWVGTRSGQTGLSSPSWVILPR